MRKNHRFIWLLILLIVNGGFLFASFYSVAKNGAIKNLDKQQSLLAVQADRGVEDFFGNWTRIPETNFC